LWQLNTISLVKRIKRNNKRSMDKSNTNKIVAKFLVPRHHILGKEFNIDPDPKKH
jgi:hypothetical protein